MTTKLEVEQLNNFRVHDNNLEWFNGTEWMQLNLPKQIPTIPVGTITTFAGITPPQGWLLCDGRAVSRTEFPDLYVVLKEVEEVNGQGWGSGDGSTTFNLPDGRAAAPVGGGTSNKYITNESKNIAAYINDQLQGHFHAISTTSITAGFADPGGGHIGPGSNFPAIPDPIRSPIADGSNGNPRVGNVTHGKQFVVNFIIKY
ncbi:MAG: phage tail protein [Spirochaetota bacterium]